MSASRFGWIIVVIVFTVGLYGSLASWAGADPGAAAAAVAQDDVAVDLFDEMMGIRNAVRSLMQQIDDPAKDEESLKLIWSMQAHIVNARDANPPTLEALAAEQHPAHLRAYRKSIAEVLREMAALEIDLLDGRRDDAKKRITETLFSLREAAHDTFQDNG